MKTFAVFMVYLSQKIVLISNISWIKKDTHLKFATGAILHWYSTGTVGTVYCYGLEGPQGHGMKPLKKRIINATRKQKDTEKQRQRQQQHKFYPTTDYPTWSQTADSNSIEHRFYNHLNRKLCAVVWRSLLTKWLCLIGALIKLSSSVSDSTQLLHLRCSSHFQ